MNVKPKSPQQLLKMEKAESILLMALDQLRAANEPTITNRLSGLLRELEVRRYEEKARAIHA